MYHNYRILPKISGVYYIINRVNFKLYIGSAINLHGRFYQHKSALEKNKHENSHLQHAYNKYGGDKFIFIIREFVTDKERLLEVEQREIDSYDWNKLYNVAPTAGSNLGLYHTDESKEKNRLAKKYMMKPVTQLDAITGSFIDEFESIRDAARRTSISHTSIKQCCSSKTKTTNRYIFIFTKDLDKFDLSSRPLPPEIRYIEKIDIQTDEILGVYESLGKAAMSLGHRNYKRQIMDCCKGKFKTAQGYKWRYRQEQEDVIISL